MKERLGIIVRAKEGKMVNVNAPLPFNLNNSANHNNDHNHRQPRLSRLRTSSPQPSLDTERQSVVSSASASHELDEDMRCPTLNVRIIRGGSALARGRPITRGAVVHEHRTEGEEETGAAPAPPALATEEQPAEAQSNVATDIGEATRIPSTAFKIQNVGSLSRSWSD